MTIVDSADVTAPPPAPPSAPSRRLLLKVVVFAAVVSTVFAIVDVREVVDILRRLPPRAIALAVVLLSLDRVMMGVKWRHLIRGGGGDMSVSTAVSIYYQSKFTTLVLPAAFGGEVLRAVLGARAGVPSDLLVASMIMERVIAALSSLVLATAGFFYFSTQWRNGMGDTVAALVVAAGCLLGAVTLFVMHRPSHKAIGRAVGRWVPERLFRLLDRLSSAVVRYGHAPRVLLTNLGLTVAEHLLLIAALAVLAQGLGVNLPMASFLAATSIVMLVRRGAGFLEGWGIAESGVVMLYTFFGVASARSAALAVALWSVSLLTCLPAGYLLWRAALRGHREGRLSASSSRQI